MTFLFGLQKTSPRYQKPEQPGIEGYEYDLTQYTKDEYIKMIDDKNAALGKQLETTQEAVDFLLLGGE